MKIIKRDGSEVPYDYRKIQSAIEAANAEVVEADRLSDTEVGFIVGRIEKRCDELGRSVSVEEVQDMVVEELASSDHFRLALHYSDYRLRHELLRKQNSTDAKVLALLRHDNELAKQENANKDPIINSTMRDYLASEVSEDICRRYIFPEDVMNAHDEGIIHVHDMGYVSGPISNCELVNLEDMLQKGYIGRGQRNNTNQNAGNQRKYSICAIPVCSTFCAKMEHQKVKERSCADGKKGNCEDYCPL